MARLTKAVWILVVIVFPVLGALTVAVVKPGQPQDPAGKGGRGELDLQTFRRQ
jgi:hypothetical protein